MDRFDGGAEGGGEQGRGRVGEGLLTLKIGQKEREIKQTNRIVYLLKNKQKQDKTKQTKKQKTETKTNKQTTKKTVDLEEEDRDIRHQTFIE